MYNKGEWGPAITLEKCCESEKCEPNCCELETPCYKQILDNIHSRIVKAQNAGSDNAEIIHKNS